MRAARFWPLWRAMDLRPEPGPASDATELDPDAMSVESAALLTLVAMGTAYVALALAGYVGTLGVETDRRAAVDALERLWGDVPDTVSPLRWTAGMVRDRSRRMALEVTPGGRQFAQGRGQKQSVRTLRVNKRCALRQLGLPVPDRVDCHHHIVEGECDDCL